MYKPLSKPAILLTFLSTLILTHCAKTTGLGATETAPVSTQSSFCVIAKPIRWSMNDTDGTILQVKELNAVGRKLCGWH